MDIIIYADIWGQSIFYPFSEYKSACNHELNIGVNHRKISKIFKNNEMACIYKMFALTQQC